MGCGLQCVIPIYVCDVTFAGGGFWWRFSVLRIFVTDFVTFLWRVLVGVWTAVCDPNICV